MILIRGKILSFFKAEGETQYRNKAVFLDLRSVEQANANITIDIPSNAVPGSENIQISAVGNDNFSKIPFNITGFR